MHRANGLAAAIWPGGLALSALLLGCHSFWQGWLDPSQVGRFEKPSVSHDIRSVISLQDEPPGIPNATEPTPEDGVVLLHDYVIGPGDVLDVSIFELFQVGVPSIERARVNDLGYITLSGVGPTKVGSKTPRQVELEIVDRLKESLKDAQVRVIVQEERHRMFNILGAVTRPGTYTILKPDFRLLDAIALAGDMAQTIQELYIIRPGTSPVRMEPDAEQPFLPQPTAPPPQSETPLTPNNSTTQTSPTLTDLSSAPAAGHNNDQLIPQEQPLSTQQHELLEALGPAGLGATQPAEPGQGVPESQPAPPLSKWIWLNGEWVEVKQPPPEQPAATTTPAEPQIDWEALAKPADQTRVIAIPADALLHGESRYNIVIRDGDVINVPLGPIGEFYVMGHVFRPGVYSLTGREITLKQAIAAAGGLAPFAWPSRCEISRRIGRDREEVAQVDLDRVFAGKEPDVFLRPNDIINVGTHALAPFLVTVRNAFRMSYGFGFVYDRNFADIDSFSGQTNPRDRRRLEQQIFP